MFRLTLLFLSLSTMAVAASRATIADLQEALNLTAVQVEAIQEVRVELREDARPVLQELKAAERQLRGQQQADAPDPATTSMLEAQIANARAC